MGQLVRFLFLPSLAKALISFSQPCQVIPGTSHSACPGVTPIPSLELGQNIYLGLPAGLPSQSPWFLGPVLFLLQPWEAPH